MTSVAGPAPLPRLTEAETLTAFDSVPLFMKSLPEEENDDIALAALRSLVHEGTPDEVARNFKEQGNEYFKGKRYREAVGFYKQGVDAKPTDMTILEALLLNRAACNLELQNYGSVLRDCAAVLSSNPTSSKAFYRSGQALLRLGRLDEAIDCCTRCLSYDPTNDSILVLKEKVLKLKQEANEREKKKIEQKEKDQREKVARHLAYRERNLVIYNKPGGSVNPVAPHFDSEDPTGKTLIFPVFFLYPQHATSDMISNFNEDTTFVAHLETMFPPHAPPPHWDLKGEYINNKLVVYATTYRKRILKVGKKMTLRDVMNAAKEKEGQERDGLELKDNCLTFVVVPKGDEETKWVEEYKKSREES